LPFAAHKAPHFIHLGVLDLSDDDVKLYRIKAFQEVFVDLCDRGLFFFKHMRRLKNSKPRMIGVCEGVRAKSTSM